MVNVENTIRPFTMTSPDFQENGLLPLFSAYNAMGCSGENTAPTLKWNNIPEGTRSLALLLNDIDAPVSGGFHHWVVYNIPATVQELQGNAPFTVGTTSMNTHAYFGPCPPPTGQAHHYVFTLYALKVERLQEENLTYEGLVRAMDGYVLGATSLIGTFTRLPETR